MIKNSLFVARLRLTHPTITRNQILFTSLFSFCVAAIFLSVTSPFSIGYSLTILTSAIFHLILYVSFEKFQKLGARTFTFISIFNLILMGAIIHFTGGILSPFVFVFFSILLSDASHGIEYPGLVAALVIYLLVIGLEYFGILQPLAITPRDIYAHGLSMAVVTIATALFMVVTSRTYVIIMSNLRTHLEKELAEKQGIMQQLLQLEAPSQIGLLVNKIVHDLRGPLGAVGGFISVLLRENELGEESKKDCEVMLSELNRIQKMIDRMIIYSRPMQPGTAVQCPVEILETVLAVFSFYPGAKDILFQRNFPAPQTLLFLANKEGLQQVYFNLFKNALEAMISEKTVRKIIDIKINKEHDRVKIMVHDNGPGIPSAVLMQLGQAITTTKKEGGGVGLIISKEIVESFGGKFTIQSEPGEGTKIETTFPLYAA